MEKGFCRPKRREMKLGLDVGSACQRRAAAFGKQESLQGSLSSADECMKMSPCKHTSCQFLQLWGDSQKENDMRVFDLCMHGSFKREFMKQHTDVTWPVQQCHVSLMTFNWTLMWALGIWVSYNPRLFPWIKWDDTAIAAENNKYSKISTIISLKPFKTKNNIFYMNRNILGFHIVQNNTFKGFILDSETPIGVFHHVGLYIQHTSECSLPCNPRSFIHRYSYSAFSSMHTSNILTQIVATGATLPPKLFAQWFKATDHLENQLIIHSVLSWWCRSQQQWVCISQCKCNIMTWSFELLWQVHR